MDLHEHVSAYEAREVLAAGALELPVALARQDRGRRRAIPWPSEHIDVRGGTRALVAVNARDEQGDSLQRKHLDAGVGEVAPQSLPFVQKLEVVSSRRRVA